MDSASTGASASVLAALPPTNPFRIDAPASATSAAGSDPALHPAEQLPAPSSPGAPATSAISSLDSVRTANSAIAEPPLPGAIAEVEPQATTSPTPSATSPAPEAAPQPPAAAPAPASASPPTIPGTSPTASSMAQTESKSVAAAPTRASASSSTAPSTPPAATTSTPGTVPAATSRTSLSAPSPTNPKRRSVLSAILGGNKEPTPPSAPAPEKKPASKAEIKVPTKAEAKAEREKTRAEKDKAKAEKNEAKRKEKEAKAQAKSKKSKATPSVPEEVELQDDGLPMPESHAPPDEYPSGVNSGASTPGRRRYTDTRQLDLLASELAAEQLWEAAQAQRMSGTQAFRAYGPQPSMLASGPNSPNTSQGSLHLAPPASARPGPALAISPLAAIHPPPQAVFACSSGPAADGTETHSLDATSHRSVGSVPRTTRSSPSRTGYGTSPDIMTGLGEGPYPSLGRRLPLDPVLPGAMDFGLPVVRENKPQGVTRKGSVGQPSPLRQESRPSSATETKQIRRAVMSMSLHDPEAEAAVAVPRRKSGWSSPFSPSRPTSHAGSRAGSRTGSRAGTPSASQGNLRDTLTMSPTSAMPPSKSSPTGLHSNRSATSLATTKRRLSFFGMRKGSNKHDQPASSANSKPASPNSKPASPKAEPKPLRAEPSAEATAAATPVVAAPSHQSSASSQAPSQAPSQALSNVVASSTPSTAELARAVSPQTEMSTLPSEAPPSQAQAKESDAPTEPAEAAEAPAPPSDDKEARADEPSEKQEEEEEEEEHTAEEGAPSPSTVAPALPEPVSSPATIVTTSSAAEAQEGEKGKPVLSPPETSAAPKAPLSTSKSSPSKPSQADKAKVHTEDKAKAPAATETSTLAAAKSDKAKVHTEDKAKAPAATETSTLAAAKSDKASSVAQSIKPMGLSRFFKRFTRSKEVPAS